MSPEQIRYFVEHNLGPTLAKAGYNKNKLKLMILDDNTPFLANWTDIVLADNRLAHVLYRWPRKWKVVLCGTQLNHWAVGWIEWNMALDLSGGPTWFERQGCGGPVYINPLKGEAYKQPSFYALGQFSKFISPDSVRIGHELVSSVDDIHVLTAKRPDNGVVVVVLNRGDDNMELNRRHIDNSDTVCVCNSTYCDDFPPIVRPKVGYLLVYESNKNGDRFKQTSLQFKPLSGKNNCLEKCKENEITISVDTNHEYQKIYGFGNAFTDSAGYMLSSVDPSLATAIINSYFSDNGIEFSFGRVPTSGADYSLRPYTYDDTYNDFTLENFSLQKEDFEWKIPYIKQAQSVCPHTLKLIGSNWSPPVWMKQIEEFIAFSELKGDVGGQYYQILANYLLKFLEAYKANVKWVPTSGADYSLRPYTYDDTYNDFTLENFSLQKEDFEWKIPYIKHAQSVCPHTLKLIGSNWSPPVWMKQIEEFIAHSELKGDVGGQYYQILADYLLKFLEAYKANGITFWGLTTENEPIEDHKLNNLKMFLEAYKANGITFWGLTTENEPIEDHKLNNLKMSASQIKHFVEYNLGPTLSKAGYDKSKLEVMIIDDNTPFLTNWTDIILADNTLAQYVSGIASHWYYNEDIGGEAVSEILEYIHDKHPDYFIMNTEACILDGPGNGNWSYAERYAFDIINIRERQLNHWAVGWIEWNMALDLSGGPTWFERKGCGGPVYIDPVKGEAYKQPSFYALGHFSKLVSPDSVRIGHELVSSVDGIYVLTAKRPDNGVVVVVLNRGDDNMELNVNYQNNWVTHGIPAHSIQSYIWYETSSSDIGTSTSTSTSTSAIEKY
ncbi:unnamed protein product [Oppiella nova]|uniref:Glucosylceramidase n=1 Tax=Oppiella nova TaxID=334625 RepID=A0A7R9LX86_9ACAR|nr:unnamed protein product [Oppiella nova]CAG2167797.1 unnamed protein product [Oppiella nova]